MLRVRFDDPKQTWIYVSPSHGQLIKADRNDRISRWSLQGLNALNISFLISAVLFDRPRITKAKLYGLAL